MGEKLKTLFQRAEQVGGIQGKIRLAALTRMTSAQAASEQDSPAAVERVGQMLQQIEKDFGGGQGGRAASATTPHDEHGLVERLRRYNSVFVELMSQRGLFLHDRQQTLARITESIATTLETGRASVWLFDEKHTRIVCADLFERAGSKHSSGIELHAKDFPAYFRAVGEERTIAAHDARTDPRTREFTEAYLKPLGITSMLDVPVWTSSGMAGVICIEHTAAARTWNADEENFAYLAAGFVALALELTKVAVSSKT